MTKGTRWECSEQRARMKHNPSPNRYDGRDREVDTIVLHYTASKGSASSVAALFAKPSRKASAHYVVGRSGDVWECVDLDDGAWHAGDGKFPSMDQLMDCVPNGTIVEASSVPKKPRDLNMRSVGIEIVNAGWLDGGPNPVFEGRHRNPASRSTKWESYSDGQVWVVDMLVEWLLQRFPTIRWITGHEDVTNRYTLGRSGAKLDPGPAFPWERVGNTGLYRVVFDFAHKGWKVIPT